MRAVQRPPTAGIVAAVTYIVLVFAPYVLFAVEDTNEIALYYDFGIAGPQYLSLLAAVGVILFAAGRERRTEPDLVAGLTLVLGLVLTIFVAIWAVSVPEDIVFALGDAAWVEHHRWLVVLAAAGLVVASLWYVRALELF